MFEWVFISGGLMLGLAAMVWMMALAVHDARACRRASGPPEDRLIQHEGTRRDLAA
jgi:hypothetical protein